VEELRAADPESVGRYRLLGRLGAGGMGTVYLGRSPGGRLVAVKRVHGELAADPDFRRRFTHELAAVRQVGGFHTAQVVDADPDGDPPWLVTAYIPGPSVAEAVDAHGPLPEPALRVLGAGLAEALEAIHAVGLVHRDLKPSNVLLADDGPRVIDFGIARALDGTAITRTQVVVGTPGYMAPEQIEGGVIGPPCDVFSLALVICHAAGCAPFGQAPAQVMLYRIVHAEPDLGALPAALRPLIAECLARDPSRRPTPEELLERFAPAPEGRLAGGWLPQPLRTALRTEAGQGAAGAVPPGGAVPGLRDAGPPAGAVPGVPGAGSPAGVVPGVPAAGSPADSGQGVRDAGPLAGSVPGGTDAGASGGFGPGPVVSGGPTRVEGAGNVPAAYPAPQPLGVFGPPMPVPPPPAPAPAPAPRRKRRRLRIVLPLALVLVAAGVAVPLFVLDGGDKPPGCFAAGKGEAATSHVTELPKGTPHAPEPVAPANRTAVEVGQSVTLSWDHAEAVSQLYISDGDHPRYSTWLHGTSCTFTPTAAGLYQWQTVSAVAEEHKASSPWSRTSYLFVRAKGSSAANPAKDSPDAPRPASPADQTVVKAGSPVTLRWTGARANSLVSVQLPDGSWKSTSWLQTSAYRYTPPSAGVYVWVAYTADDPHCEPTGCISAASEQRYLVVE
jgi:hypothetical protein